MSDQSAEALDVDVVPAALSVLVEALESLMQGFCH